MFRNLKTLGLTLVAAFALSAMAASAASAQTALVSGGPTVLGHDTENAINALTGAAGVECAQATYPGEVSGSTITVGLEFSECTTSAGAPATVTDNGCQYIITLGTLETAHTAPATAALTCPKPGDQVDIMIYEDPGHEKEVCTVEIPQQHGLTGLHVTDETNDHLRITGTVEGITNYVAGGCVGGGTVNLGNAVLHADITLTDGKGGNLGLE